MTDNSTTESVDINDDLESFEAAFYEKETVAPDEPVDEQEEEVEDTGEDAPAKDTDEDASEEDESAEDQEEEEAPKPEPKGKKKSEYQERINELTKARREAERREALLLQRLEAVEAAARNKETETPVTEQLPQGAPRPDAVDKNGDLLYPLGEFDPKFITDLTTFTIEQKTKAIEEEQAKKLEAAKVAQQQTELVTQWEGKLQKVEEEVPDIREHIENVVTEIQRMNVDPGYGDYLAMTVMQCDNGPAILEYLSENIGEAQKIVASGPAAATLAIGKLDAKFALAAEPIAEEKRNIAIPTSKTPPPVVTKGRGARTTIREDTDNLDDFEKLFYGK